MFDYKAKRFVAVSLVNPKDVFLPLHLKLGLIKNKFSKVRTKEEKVFNGYLRNKFSRLNPAKVKKGIFVGL